MKPDDVYLSDLKIINHEKGDIFHALKKTDIEYSEFGEAYFSSIKHSSIKAWKRHTKMTLNIIVPVGAIKFVIYDDRQESKTRSEYFEICLSRENYQRLTVPKGLWMGFQGISKSLNLLLNIADMPHDPDEVERCDIDDIKYDWSLKQ